MTRQGKVILDRMSELIDRYEAGGIDLRPLVEQLNSLHESLPQPDQPPDRDWLDGIIPLERAVKGGSPEDRRRVEAQIRGRLAHLRAIIEALRSAG